MLPFSRGFISFATDLPSEILQKRAAEGSCHRAGNGLIQKSMIVFAETGPSCRLRRDRAKIKTSFLLILYKDCSSCFLFAWRGLRGLDATHSRFEDEISRSIFCLLLLQEGACLLFHKFQSIHRRFCIDHDKRAPHYPHGSICQSSQALSQHSIGLPPTILQSSNSDLFLSFFRLLDFILHFFFLIVLGIFTRFSRNRNHNAFWVN